jgi:hypothetical protein
MKENIKIAVATVPAASEVMKWGEVRLYPQTLRDMMLYASKDYDGTRYIIVVDVDTANTMNSPDGAFAGETGYRAAAQNGVYIGSFMGSDVCVFDTPTAFQVVKLICLDDDDNVVHVVSSKIQPFVKLPSIASQLSENNHV